MLRYTDSSASSLVTVAIRSHVRKHANQMDQLCKILRCDQTSKARVSNNNPISFFIVLFRTKMSEKSVEEGEISEEQARELLEDTNDESSVSDLVESMFHELNVTIKDVVDRVSKMEAGHRPTKRRRRESSSEESASENEISDTEQLVAMADTASTSKKQASEGSMADTALSSRENKGDKPSEKPSDTQDTLLKEIAQDFDWVDETGPKVREKLAEIVNKRWAERLDDTKFKSKMEKFLRPENCDRVIVPKINPEIWSNLSNATKSADLHIPNFQKTLTKAGNALT